MIAAFIDESERGSNFYFLGSLVITQDNYFVLRASMRKLHTEVIEKYPHVPDDFEFHAWEIMNGKNHWGAVPLRYRINVFSRVLKAVVDSSSCIHVVGIDREKHRKKYEGRKDLFPAREIALMYVLEAIDRCNVSSSEVNGERHLVRVFADDHHTKQESTTNFTNYQDYGTWGYKSSMLDNLHPSIDFRDSRGTFALQAVDCVTYLYNRVRTHKETNPKASAAKKMLWEILTPLFSGCSTKRVWP